MDKKVRKEKKKRDIVVDLLDLVIVVMIFVILSAGYNLWFYITVANESSSFMQDSKMMSFELQNNDYASLIQGKYINEINGSKESKSYQALADYTEAASKYKIYVKKGDNVAAQKQKAIMDKARSEMGKLTIFADNVDDMFE